MKTEDIREVENKGISKMAPEGSRESGHIGRSHEGDLRGTEFTEDKRTAG